MIYPMYCFFGLVIAASIVLSALSVRDALRLQRLRAELGGEDWPDAAWNVPNEHAAR